MLFNCYCCCQQYQPMKIVRYYYNRYFQPSLSFPQSLTVFPSAITNTETTYSSTIALSAYPLYGYVAITSHYTFLIAIIVIIWNKLSSVNILRLSMYRVVCCVWVVALRLIVGARLAMCLLW